MVNGSEMFTLQWKRCPVLVGNLVHELASTCRHDCVLRSHKRQHNTLHVAKASSSKVKMPDINAFATEGNDPLFIKYDNWLRVTRTNAAMRARRLL